MPAKIGILTSGGDAPGMNAAIRAATLLGWARGCEVYGIRHGYKGVLDGEIELLPPDDVATIIRDGGTILGSARCLDWIERGGRDQGRARLAEAGLEGLIVIGGNGSLTGAAALADPAEAGDSTLRVVGVPASIDNDVGLTAYAIGVDTAINTIVDACDKISDTASAHDRVFIVEVMGRDCGYLAMTSGIASAADAVLFRESKKSEDEIVDAVVDSILKARSRSGRSKRVLIIKAEGLGITTDALKEKVDAKLADRGPIETRVTVLGHVVRGGRPSSFDRLLASRLAHAAVRALIDGQTLKMAAWASPGPTPSGVQRFEHDPHCWLADLDTVLSETARLLDGSSGVTQWRARIFDEIADVLSL